MGKTKTKGSGGNGNNLQQTYCPFCHLVVAPGNREVILTKKGKAHFSCAVKRYLTLLNINKLGGVTEPWQFKNFLVDQAECLLDQRCTKKGEKKFQTILQIHEELYGQPLKISSIVASA